MSEETSSAARASTASGDLVELLKALADPNRLRMLALLHGEELCVGEIEYLLGINQSNVSRHLERLRRAGLVRATKRAQWVYYALDDATLSRFPSIERILIDIDAERAPFAADRAALRTYRASGMCCSDLPNCRRNKKT